MATRGLQPILRDACVVEAFDEARYHHFFSRLTGKEPYPYQIRLAKSLAEGKSIILRAPTGSGKTWATVAPFVYSVAINSKFSDRLIYALPLRTLASNIYESTWEKLKEANEFQGQICRSPKGRRYQSRDSFYLGLQMGGQQDDPFFEGDITFTTIDQLLSSYLFAPVSLPNRVGNIGAGALVGSLLVFDEVHLLDPQRSFATTIEMLDRLKGLSQFVLMTATMPDSVIQWLEKKLEAKSISLSPPEVRQLPSHAEKQRAFQWHPSPLSAEDIVSKHKNRTIVIVNTVGLAQELVRQVRKDLGGQSGAPQVFLLHSRFFPEDRRYWESKLADYFGPNATLGNAILISTQVVEAGIDISGDVLLTELAPLNSLLQRAGRVARYLNRNIGQFLVYAPLTDDQGRLKLGPYRDDSEVVIATMDLLTSTGELPSVSYPHELEWLKCIHDIPDLKALTHLEYLHAHRQHVLAAMDGLDESACSRLIREIGSVNIVLTNEPETLRFNAREWPELLSLPRSSLFRLKGTCAKAGASEWVLKVPEEIQSESNHALNFQWRTIKNPAAVAWLVAINPAHANYSKEFGLELEKASNTVSEVRYKPSAPIPRYSYLKEPFVTHATRVADCGSRILAQCPHALQRLGQIYKGFSVRDVFMLACALHDTGKLQSAWQNEAERWQQHIDAKLGRDHKSQPLAHTDFDWERDRGDQWCRFPPHAACGGFALLPYFLEQFPNKVAVLLCTAIARHHGTHTKELNQFEFVKEAEGILEQCVPGSSPRSVTLKPRPEAGDLASFSEEYLLHLKEDESWWALYANVIRVLRLADQGSFQD
ncbi:MAG TPA: CRISPR-associated helicase Cas3' [Candidatus Angelobacter sp.]|nr:CRISPR-associated helicase Cas3' [Candidatus Angelobacter sp.]